MPCWESDHTAKPTGKANACWRAPCGGAEIPPDAARLFEIPKQSDKKNDLTDDDEPVKAF